MKRVRTASSGDRRRDGRQDRLGRANPDEPAEEGALFGEVGALVGSTILIYGRFPFRFTTRTAVVTRGQSIRVDYIAGSFRGKGLWCLQSVNGRTRLSYRWRTDDFQTIELLRIVDRFAEQFDDLPELIPGRSD